MRAFAIFLFLQLEHTAHAWSQTEPFAPLAKVFNNAEEYAASPEALVLVDEDNFVEQVLDESTDVLLVIAQSNCTYCSEVEAHLRELKKRFKKGGITSVRIAIMDANATNENHPAMKRISYGLHYPAILLYSEMEKIHPISLSDFVGDLGPQMLVNDLTGMLLWHKMWEETELENFKNTMSPKLWDKIQKDAAFTNAGLSGSPDDHFGNYEEEVAGEEHEGSGDPVAHDEAESSEEDWEDYDPHVEPDANDAGNGHQELRL
jgi:hypothetical protein